MDSGTWLLRVLWRFPQLPKKKIKLFIRLGDYFSAKGKHETANFCYQQVAELADQIGAIYYIKKLNQKNQKLDDYSL